MALNEKDLSVIESIVHRTYDDMVILIKRSLERVEDHIDDTETRIYSRLCDFEDNIVDNNRLENSRGIRL